MMMNSYRRSNSNTASRRRLFVATILVLLILAIDLLSGGSVRGLVRNISVRVWSVGSGAVNSVMQTGFFSSRAGLQRENDSLRQEISQLQIRGAGYSVLKEENEALRALVRLAEQGSGITAPIVSSVRSSPYGTFSIGAGSNDGVTVGSIVLTGDSESAGFVIGLVQETGKRTSLVRELFAPGVSTEGVLKGASVIAEGQGGGNARLEAPRDLVVAAGDPLVSPTFGGYAIGLVGAVEIDEGAAHTDVYVGLPVSLSSLKFVYVIPQQ